jgi:prolyl 4-hydroxylase
MQHAELTIVWMCPSSNTWDSPTYMVDVDDENNEGAGYLLKEKVWNAVQDMVEEWTGQLQVGSSVYGIRSYTSGAILSPHVDR